MYRLVPTWIDVDVSGWELEGDARGCHRTFDDDPVIDVVLAQRWADQVIGHRLTWRRAGSPGLEHYEAG